MNRVLAALTLLLGLSAMMIGVYATQWDIIQTLVRAFVPFLG